MFENTETDMIEHRLQEWLVALLITIPDVIVSLFEQLDEQEIMENVINDDEVFERIGQLICPI